MDKYLQLNYGAKMTILQYCEENKINSKKIKHLILDRIIGKIGQCGVGRCYNSPLTLPEMS